MKYVRTFPPPFVFILTCPLLLVTLKWGVIHSPKLPSLLGTVLAQSGDDEVDFRIRRSASQQNAFISLVFPTQISTLKLYSAEKRVCKHGRALLPGTPAGRGVGIQTASCAACPPSVEESVKATQNLATRELKLHPSLKTHTKLQCKTSGLTMNRRT